MGEQPETGNYKAMADKCRGKLQNASEKPNCAHCDGQTAWVQMAKDWPRVGRTN
jgi:hypothetical protein